MAINLKRGYSEKALKNSDVTKFEKKVKTELENYKIEYTKHNANKLDNSNRALEDFLAFEKKLAKSFNRDSPNLISVTDSP